MTRRDIDWPTAVALVVVLAGCTQPAPEIDVSHVHGLAHDGEALYIATHHGVAKGLPGEPWTWRYVGSDRYDYMGFTQDAAQPGVFYSSGHPDDPYSFGGVHLGLRRSTDGAESWEQRSLKGEVDFHALTSFDAGALAGYWQGILMASSDGGATWTNHEVPAHVTALGGSQRLLAATTEGLYETTDLSNWSRLEAELGIIASLAVSGDLVLASTRDGVSGSLHRSLDGGASWTELATGLEGAAPVVFAIDPHDEEHLFASTAGATVAESADQGESWTTIRP